MAYPRDAVTCPQTRSRAIPGTVLRSTEQNACRVFGGCPSRARTGRNVTSQIVAPMQMGESMAIAVQKYGGSSLGDPGKIRTVAGRIAQSHRAGRACAVVVS